MTEEKIINGIPVVSVETEEEFLQYLGERPMECPPGMAEKFGFTDAITPDELEAEFPEQVTW